MKQYTMERVIGSLSELGNNVRTGDAFRSSLSLEQVRFASERAITRFNYVESLAIAEYIGNTLQDIAQSLKETPSMLTITQEGLGLLNRIEDLARSQSLHAFLGNVNLRERIRITLPDGNSVEGTVSAFGPKSISVYDDQSNRLYFKLSEMHNCEHLTPEA